MDHQWSLSKLCVAVDASSLSFLLRHHRAIAALTPRHPCAIFCHHRTVATLRPRHLLAFAGPSPRQDFTVTITPCHNVILPSSLLLLPSLYQNRSRPQHRTITTHPPCTNPSSGNTNPPSPSPFQQHRRSRRCDFPLHTIQTRITRGRSERNKRRKRWKGARDKEMNETRKIWRKLPSVTHTDPDVTPMHNLATKATFQGEKKERSAGARMKIGARISLLKRALKRRRSSRAGKSRFFTTTHVRDSIR